ncbi:hypothetical protein [Microbacterium sp. gxy059]|uniref:hypothetical protein n=1 Tax=Microbacterium sp. gxy059 TaxID=2957199 RepID=UPI003D962BB0
MTRTALHPAPRAELHEHAWETESTHLTSGGRIRYVRCAICGSRRVDAQPLGALAPSAASRTVG